MNNTIIKLEQLVEHLELEEIIESMNYNSFYDLLINVDEDELKDIVLNAIIFKEGLSI